MLSTYYDNNNFITIDIYFALNNIEYDLLKTYNIII